MEALSPTRSPRMEGPSETGQGIERVNPTLFATGAASRPADNEGASATRTYRPEERDHNARQRKWHCPKTLKFLAVLSFLGNVSTGTLFAINKLKLNFNPDADPFENENNKLREENANLTATVDFYRDSDKSASEYGAKVNNYLKKNATKPALLQNVTPGVKEVTDLLGETADNLIRCEGMEESESKPIPTPEKTIINMTQRLYT